MLEVNLSNSLDQTFRSQLIRNFTICDRELERLNDQLTNQSTNINGLKYSNVGDRIASIEQVIQGAQGYHLPGKGNDTKLSTPQYVDGWHGHHTDPLNLYYSSDIMLQRVNSNWQTYKIGSSYHHWFEIKKYDIDNERVLPKLDRISDSPISPAYIMAKHPYAVALSNGGPSDSTFIMDGQIIKDRAENSNNGTNSDDNFGTMAITASGHSRWYAKDVSASTLISDGVKYATSTFPPVMINGKEFDLQRYGWERQNIVTDKAPRMLLIEKEKSWVLAHVIGRFNDSHGMNYEEMVQWLLHENDASEPSQNGMVNNGKIINAFNLDGGGSSFLAVDGQNIAPIMDNKGRTPRKLMGVVYFEKDDAKFGVEKPLSRFMASQISMMTPEMYGGRE